MDIKCKKCGRFLGSTEHSVQVMLKCPNCRSYLLYRIVLLSQNDRGKIIVSSLGHLNENDSH